MASARAVRLSPSVEKQKLKLELLRGSRLKLESLPVSVVVHEHLVRAGCMFFGTTTRRTLTRLHRPDVFQLQAQRSHGVAKLCSRPSASPRGALFTYETKPRHQKRCPPPPPTNPQAYTKVFFWPTEGLKTSCLNVQDNMLSSLSLLQRFQCSGLTMLLLIPIAFSGKHALHQSNNQDNLWTETV